MREKCTKNDCPAPRGMCLEQGSHEHPKCKYWGGASENNEPLTNKTGVKKATSLPWTGEAFQPEDIEIVSQRSYPLIVGMVGCADAGKTSYLGMLYTLLFNGKKLSNWNFAGSYTLAAWETLAQCLKIKSNGGIKFAPPTPANPDYYSLFHLALKKGGLFRDVLFADSSGEVFTLWSEDTQDVNAENARWIYENSSAFIFMVDSVALIEKRGEAKGEIVQIAEQLAANLNGRPVAIVWSKADKIKDIPTIIKNSLEEDISIIFKDQHVFEVTNFSKSDTDVLCHKNNIDVIEYILDKLIKPNKATLEPVVNDSDDLFFQYRGEHNDG